MHVKQTKHFFRFSSNSEAFASELLENLEEILATDSKVITMNNEQISSPLKG